MVLEKRLGERASLGCPDNDTARCDVDFAINAIEPNQQCDDTYGSPIGPTQQLLRFDLEVWTAPQFAHDVDSALFLEHWGVGDAQGVDTNLQDHTAIRCNGELTGDQISKFLLPGAHFTKSIFVTAPQNATVLRLYLGNQGDGWTWPVPTA
ncbi:hypothetical protein BKG82_28700 [Mycobacteroides chelonae]|uniref:Uncharacterized protein n=2 Tax=Mycobacteroides chelonae TaxID=1774 RepID=A0A1S1LC91_MYCCH|nr:hypothetical protein BKG82_28700 [Mycobacteroides chelonae]